MAMRGNMKSLLGAKSAKKPPVVRPKPVATRVAKAPKSDGAKFKAATGSNSMKKMFMDGCKGA